MEVVDGAVLKMEASSPQIAGINQDLIETVRFGFVKEAVQKKLKVAFEKNLLTREEFFEAVSEKK